MRQLLPGAVEYVTSQRETTGVEQYAAATQRLDQAAGAIEFQVPMSVLKEPRGIVEVFEGFGVGRRPAVMRHGVGLGRVTFVAFDLDQSPFREWTDRPRLVARLLGPLLGEQDPTGPQWASENTSVESQGVPDLLGQLRVALDQFDRVRLVPFSLTAGLIAVYLLLIGPLDYWWLKRKRRMEWTWLTFPLIVLAFLGLVAGLAYAWKGGRHSDPPGGSGGSGFRERLDAGPQLGPSLHSKNDPSGSSTPGAPPSAVSPSDALNAS